MLTSLRSPAGNKNLWYGLLVIAAFSIFSACKKTKSDPANPKLYYSPWLSATWQKGVYTDDYGQSDTAYTYSITNVNRLTQDVLDNGTVLVYIQYSGSSTVYPLPYTDPYSSLNWWFEDGVDTLSVNYAYDPLFGGVDPGAYPDGSISIRYIILTGGVPTGAANPDSSGEILSSTPSSATAQGKNKYQQMSYEEICKLFGIPE